jgi:Mn2+-dependent serine/threonine protein kinase
MEERLNVCGKDYRILTLLGRGKGGYSYLAECCGQQAVVKQIHHEPCDYYTFGDKIEAGRRDYGRLLAAGIRIPRMLDIDPDAERIVKEYIEGPTVFELVRDGTGAAPYLAQVRCMAEKAKAAGLNIDYFPTNFVARDGLIWYVDYECSDYSDEWSFENWGIRYWSRTPEFEAYLKDRCSAVTVREERITAEEYIGFLKRTDLGSQYPKERFEQRIARLVKTVSVSLTARDGQGLLVGVLFGLTDYAYWLYITDLGVDRAYVRRGIGTRLMQTAHQLAGGEKDIAVYLIANEKAVPFYEKYGMKKADDVMQYNHIEWTGFTVT